MFALSSTQTGALLLCVAIIAFLALSVLGLFKPVDDEEPTASRVLAAVILATCIAGLAMCVDVIITNTDTADLPMELHRAIYTGTVFTGLFGAIMTLMFMHSNSRNRRHSRWY